MIKQWLEADRPALKGPVNAGRSLDDIMSADGGDGETLLGRFAAAGIDVDALAARLQDEGARSFVVSWSGLIAVITSRSDALK